MEFLNFAIFKALLRVLLPADCWSPFANGYSCQIPLFLLLTAKLGNQF
jgi:hypothetical protein